MQFGSRHVNPNAWKGSGVVTGRHTHTAPLLLGSDVPVASQRDSTNQLKFDDAGVRFSKDVMVPSLVDPTDSTNFLSFETDEVVIEKDIRIKGELHVAGWPPPGGDMQLPTDPTFNTVTTNGDVTCHGVLRGHSVVSSSNFTAPILEGDHLVSAPTVNCTNLEVDNVNSTALVEAPTVKATGHVHTPEIRVAMTGENEYKFVTLDDNKTEITVGGGTVSSLDMPATKYRPNHISHSIGGEGGFVMDHTSTTITHGTTEVKLQEDEHKMTIGEHIVQTGPRTFTRHMEGFEHQTIVEEIPADQVDPVTKVSKVLRSTIDYLSSFVPNAGPELRRRMADGVHFVNEQDQNIKSYGITNQHTESVHVTADELDLNDPDALINKSGNDLLQALKTAHHPRSLITQSEASFGLFQNDANAGDPHFYLYQQAATTDSYLKQLIDTQWHYVTNRRADGGAWKVYWKGYDAQDIYQREGCRLAVNNYGELGKVYIGRWDNGLPNHNHNSNDLSFDMVNLQGSLRFSEVPSTAYPSGEIYMKASMTDGLQVDHLRSLTGTLEFHNTVDFSGASVTGLPGLVGSITESTTAINVDSKPIHLLPPEIGADINTQIHHDRVTTVRIDSGNSTMNAHGAWDFANATVTGLPEGGDTFNNIYESGGALMVLTDRTIQFAGGHTIVAQDHVFAQRFGRDNHVYCDYVNNDNSGRYITWSLYGDEDLMRLYSTGAFSRGLECRVPIYAPKKGSSGNFTHCHLTEGSQAITWEPGRVVVSTGEFCSRADDGSLIGDPKDAPTGSHAICKVAYAGAGTVALGVIASAETVTSQEVHHEHGGITLVAAVQESDGHKMVRVASSGDVMAWVVQPTFAEIDVPPLSGLWAKCKTDEYANEVVLSNHVGVEADGYLSVDSQIIDTSTATVTVAADKVCVYHPAPTMTPDLFSGLYTKTINGITQDINIVMHCNADYSFSFSEHFPSFEARVSALEATIAELTGPE